MPEVYHLSTAFLGTFVHHATFSQGGRSITVEIPKALKDEINNLICEKLVSPFAEIKLGLPVAYEHFS